MESLFYADWCDFIFFLKNSNIKLSTSKELQKLSEKLSVFFKNTHTQVHFLKDNLSYS